MQVFRKSLDFCSKINQVHVWIILNRKCNITMLLFFIVLVVCRRRRYCRFSQNAIFLANSKQIRRTIVAEVADFVHTVLNSGDWLNDTNVQSTHKVDKF